MENKIIIDCSNFTSKDKLHAVIKEKLNNENYTGNNLDALYDTLMTINTPTDISFINISVANALLEQYFDRFIKVILASVEGNESLNITFSY